MLTNKTECNTANVTSRNAFLDESAIAFNNNIGR